MQRPVRLCDEVVTCFRDGEVTLRHPKKPQGIMESLFEVGYQGVREGDLVIHDLDAYAGAIGVSDSDGKTTPACAVCTTLPGADAHYLALLFRDLARNGFLFAAARGVRERVADLLFGNFASLKIPLPPPDEQLAIVRRVAVFDGKMNRLVAAKERMLALLDEQEQALLQHVVDTNTANGEILRLPFTRCFSTRIDNRGTTPNRTDSGRRLVTSKNVRQGYVDYEVSVDFVSESHEFENARRPEVGDLLMTTEAPMGHFALADRPDISIAQRVVAFRPRLDLVVPEFLLMVCRSGAFQDELRRLATGAGAVGIRTSRLSELQVAVSSLESQRTAVRWFDDHVRPVLRAKRRLAKELALLREYRARIVSDVVTGQREVRCKPEFI
ncbi:MAG: restriction endonuclease subunit S [Fimbriimonadaceae bacterium]|nr:restriction endonuclease subunit S [Fimbriimonadaceae bacterium]QYK55964.1 MAG: restriction endonuclease subunit S [Fimbriimonadaceae bacterium]